MDILKETHALLDSARSELTVIEIAEQSGVGLPWLRKFTQGALKNPGILHVQKLHGYLSRRQDGVKAASR